MMHEFLIGSGCKLTPIADDLITIRDYMKNLPETKATFYVSDIDDINWNIHEIHMEFIKSWKLHDIYVHSDRNIRYINPNYIHSTAYSDIVVQCQCGIDVFNGYSSVPNYVTKQPEHKDDCLPHYRLESRAKLLEQRYNEAIRLSELGWRGIDMAKRFGCSRDSIGKWLKSYNTSMGELRQGFETKAGNTYAFLVKENGVNAQKLADLYGYDTWTLNRWYKESGTYELGDEVQLGRDDEGKFQWTNIPVAADD